jgi:thiamine biosynthesis lipoprotein
MKTQSFQAMGSRIFIALDLPENTQEPLFDLVPQWFKGWESVLSRFQLDSELSRLNLQRKTWVPVSNVLWDVLQCARDAYTLSNGLVNAAMLKAIEDLGYIQDFSSLPKVVHKKNMPLENQANFGFEEIQFNTANQSVTLPVGSSLDLGGIAKGWAAQQAMLRLSRSAPALVNAGGDIAISGVQQSGEPWSIGVTDPLNPEAHLQVLQVKSGGVATSGKDYHQWQVNGSWVHHILDPRTGQPAQTDILTATILAPSVLEAETAAKTVFILGSQEGMQWLKSHPDFTGLLILNDKSIITNEKMQAII